MANAKQITIPQATQKAERLGYTAKPYELDKNYLAFYTAEGRYAGRAKIRDCCVDAVTVSLLIGTERLP